MFLSREYENEILTIFPLKMVLKYNSQRKK